MNPDLHPFASLPYGSAVLAVVERLERQAAAQALHTIPDPMTARERAEREAASGEMG